jgi:hypothetical protein
MVSKHEILLEALADMCRLSSIISRILRGGTGIVTVLLYATNLPVAIALGEPRLDALPGQTQAPIFKLEAPFHYAAMIFMAVYLLIMLFLRARTRYYSTAFRASYALMISMGTLSFIVNRDEFADSIRTTYVRS